MFEALPEMMSRKIPEANVQQAFVVDVVHNILVKKPDARILCVGAFEDTATNFLGSKGVVITNIDPVENVDLDKFYDRSPEPFDIIFATSVLEHVPADEVFVSKIGKLLKRGGTAILTCDFNDEYKPGAPVPATVVRQYTKADLLERLPAVLDEVGCKIIGKPTYAGKPDFHYQGHDYCFASFVFKKR
jgi:SAM-dependent methyltransferase